LHTIYKKLRHFTCLSLS